MWPSQLQVAEETTCLGWLLFLTDELDKAALCKEIWQMTGVQVALHFWAIDDGTLKRSKQVMSKDDKEKKTKLVVEPPVKMLHLEINQSEPYASKH